MIQIDNSNKITVKSSSLVNVKQTLNTGSRKIPIEANYDFSDIPETEHEFVLWYLANI